MSAAAGPAEIDAMRRAIALAGQSAADVLPNPVVGCVLLGPDGTIVGEGRHQRHGGPHAEVNALTAAGAAASGATAVVTLEPCNHYGNTGPCSQALIAAGVTRVVIGNLDPWLPAAGGIAVLRAAGIEVVAGVLPDEAADMNRVWLSNVALRRPFVTFKAGITLDGRVAAPDGTSKWITSPESRADVHVLRQRVDTMLVGIGTVLADDPLLTVRADGVPVARQPLRVVADSAGRTPAGARVRNSDAATWVATADEVGRDAGGRLDLAKLLNLLWQRGQRHVLLEGGPTLAAAFFDAGLVDEVVLYAAPKVLGAGRPVVDGGVAQTLKDAHALDLREVVTIGQDVKLRYAVRR